MSVQRVQTKKEYLNEYHRKWNERCMETLKRTLSTSYSEEFLRAQSLRLNEEVRKAEEESRKKRKSF